MKKFFVLNVIITLMITTSCTNGLYDITPKDTPVEPYDFSAVYKYMGVMYDQNTGAQINNAIMNRCENKSHV